MSPREMKILLTKAWDDPYYVLLNRKCHNSEFCREFIEQFNEVSFEQPRESLERGFLVRKLARLTRDPHLIAVSAAVLATAYRAEGLPESRVDLAIAEAVDLAQGCICCLSEIYRRKGVVLLYRKNFQEGCCVLSDSINWFRQIDNRDGVARALISRGTGFCALGHFDAAIEDEREGIELLSLASPSRYYIAAIVNSASILVYAQQDNQANKEEMLREALSILDRLAEILKGQKRRHERVRVIMRWIRGLISALQGHRKQAFRLLRSAKNGLERLGMRAEILAISADIATLYKRSERSNDDQVIQLAEECLEAFPDWEQRDILLHLQRNPEVEVIQQLRLAAGSRVPALI